MAKSLRDNRFILLILLFWGFVLGTMEGEEFTLICVTKFVLFVIAFVASASSLLYKSSSSSKVISDLDFSAIFCSGINSTKTENE